MTTFQFLPNPSSDNFAIRRFNLESDVMPPRADAGNGDYGKCGRQRTDERPESHSGRTEKSCAQQERK